MAQVTGAFDTYEAKGNREELADAIYQITPEDTPFMTLIGRQPVRSTHPEWQTDVLAAPAANAQIEGETWVFTDLTPTARVGNYCQIADKKMAVTRTQDMTLKAGRKSELKRELKKKGVELKKDMEFALVSNNASVAGNVTTARQLGGFRAWLTSNTSLGATGANGGFNPGTGLVNAATNGTQRAFTQILLNDVLEATYKASDGRLTTLMVSPFNKRVFSTFAGISELRTKVEGKDQATIHAGADMYVSDFGSLMVLPNRVMGTAAATARNAFVISPEYVKVGIFDDITMHEVAKIGDAERRVLTVEYTLCVKNEAAHGVIADLFGLTAAT